MGNLYCTLQPKGSEEVRLIQVNRDLQESLAERFALMAEQFCEQVDDYVPFDGAYRPDENQLLRMPLTAEMAAIARQMDAGAIGRDRYDPGEVVPDEIRALFWHYQVAGANRILVQNFTRAQAVSRRGTLISWSDGETFTRFEEPAILISNKIDGIISNDQFDFASFFAAKQIFDLGDVYREATQAEIAEFISLPSIDVVDEASFTEKLNSTQRRLIFAIHRADTFNILTVDDIVERANSTNLAVIVNEGRVTMPSGRELTHLLRFLDNGVYRSPINNETYVSNSHKRI